MHGIQFIKSRFGCLFLAAALWSMPLHAQTDSLTAHATEPLKTQESSETPAPAASSGGQTTGQTPQELWDAANTAYINSDFHTAIEIYERILAQRLASSKLYYNLGNAYFKEGSLGKAILFYHRALRLKPGNEDIRYNLGVAESRTKDTIEQVPEFFAATWLRMLRQTMGCTSWSIFSLLLLALALGMLLLYLLAQRLVLRKAGFFGTLIALLLCITATWFAAVERREILSRDEAIVMSASSAVKSSPDHAATDLFLLHEGTKVKIADQLDGWAEITIADGKKGWIEVRKIEVI